MNNKYTVIDLFAGAGGLSKAFLKAGAEIIWANESDKNACDLYRENFKHVYLLEGDLQEVKNEDIPEFDLLIGGFPCQSFSSVRKDGKSPNVRKSPLYEVIRIIISKNPKAFLLESDKRLRNHDNGITLKIVMEELQHAGYHIKSAVLNAKDYGNVPHNKERMYIVGFKEKREFEMFEYPTKIQLVKKVSDIININEKKDKLYYCGGSLEILKDIKGKELTEGIIYQFRYHRNKFREDNIWESYICPALTLYISNNIYIPMIKDDWGIRKLTPNECFCFQGFNDINIPLKSNNNIWYKYASNCSLVAVTERIAKNMLYALGNKTQIIEPDNSLKIDNVKLSCDLKLQTKSSIKTNNNPEEINSSVKGIFEQISENTIEKGKTKNIIEKEKPLSNEKDFTISKVIPALKNKECFDVRYNHGCDEYGKDITYKYKDNFETIRCGAAQVKFGDISGGAQGDIDIILGQIDDAFNMPFMDIKENKELNVSQLLIVCSGKYTKNAIEKIKNKVKKGYDVRFFDGQDIDNLLD